MKENKFFQSDIRSMSIECDKVGGLNLSQGISSRKINHILKLQAIKAIEKGYNQYSKFDGLEKLKYSIKNKLFKYNNLNYKSTKNIVITTGATGAFYCTMKALFKKKDEVILFEPYYGYHLNTLLILNLLPRFLKLDLNNLKFSEKELNSLINPKTKALVLCSPNNPSGKVFSKKEIQLIADICNKNNIILITDEIYEYFVYDNFKHVSPASMNSIFDNAIVISGYSKTFSITGWRIGYVACKKEWAHLIGYVNDLIYVCAPTPLQFAVAEGINNIDENFYINLKKDFQDSRDKLCEALDSAGLRPVIPQGSYYVLADAGKIKGENSKEKAMFILNKTGIATVPGSAFYNDILGENYIRFCFSVEDGILNEACKRLKKF